MSFPDGAYYNYTLNENGTLVKYGSKPQDYSTDVLAGKALDFLERADGTKPFFLYLSTRAPHDSYAAAPRYVGRFKDAPIVHTANFNEPDMSDKPRWWQALAPRQARDIDGARRKEYASLLAVDDAVKEIFGTLKQKGLLSRTVVVFMTDNGVALGEHRWRGKTCVYEPCIRTPLLVSYPGAKARKVSALVTNADIAPTFAEIAGATTPPVDGRSFLDILTGAVPTQLAVRGALPLQGGQVPEQPAHVLGGAHTRVQVCADRSDGRARALRPQQGSVRGAERRGPTAVRAGPVRAGKEAGGDASRSATRGAPSANLDRPPLTAH